jgi:aspartyl-tRNA(Asn)/glutamyl-tRNA(Gln) amidotransferase subunit A
VTTESVKTWRELETRNARINAFVEWAMAHAFSEGPLDGVSIGVKANIAVHGLARTGGLAHLRYDRADTDATVVARLREGGAAILGTLNMHEAALGATTANPFYGLTTNPHRDGYTPGGSSGGSGAAVAAGLCDVALGTDTLGSIRIPAAYCGAYGLKPTLGAVPTDGLLFLEPAFDVIGPMAMDLGLLERAWGVMAPDASADQSPFTRMIVLGQLGGVSCQPAVVAAYARALSAVALPTVPHTVPSTLPAIRLAALVRCVGYLQDTYGDHKPQFSRELREIITAVSGKAKDDGLLLDAASSLLAALGDDGVLITPTAPQVAFAHGTRAPANQADFTTLASIAGLPALAVPAGTDSDGLPVSVQLIGPAGSERRLIALATQIEPQLGGAIRPNCR